MFTKSVSQVIIDFYEIIYEKINFLMKIFQHGNRKIKFRNCIELKNLLNDKSDEHWINREIRIGLFVYFFFIEYRK